jgi:hypothetical protein
MIKRSIRTTIVSAAVAVGLMSASVASAASVAPGSGATDIYVAGTISSGTTNIVVDYRNGSTGASSASFNGTITGYGRAAYLAASSGLGAGWSGSVIVSADNDVAAVGVMKWTGGSRTDGKASDVYAALSTTSDTIYFPYAVYSTLPIAGPACDNNTKIQYSRFTLQNTSSTTVNVGITYKARSGNNSYNKQDSIVGYGAKTYDFSVPGGAVPNFNGGTDWSATGCNWAGAIIVTGTQASLAGALSNFWEQYSGTYAAIPPSQASSTVYFPSLERRVASTADNFNPASNFPGLSSIIVQNVDTNPTTITVTWTSRTTGLTTGKFTTSLAAGQAKGFNTRAGADTPADACVQYTGLNCTQTNNRDFYQYLAKWDDVVSPPNTVIGSLSDSASFWVGSATVTGAPGAKLIAANFALRQFSETNGDMSLGAAASTATNTCYLPYAARNMTGGAGTEWSLLRVVNTSGSPTSNVDFYFFNANGTSAGTWLDQSATANGGTVNGANMKTTTFNFLGSGFKGSLRVTADVAINCLAEVLWSDDGGSIANQYATYNGINK